MTDGDASWQGLSFPTGDVYQWEPDSTYIRQAPYFDGMTMTPTPVTNIAAARVLAWLGDSVTTDHISPAGSIKANGPAGKYLSEHGVKPADFNSYGSRRGNHEVMVRGTFANVRLRNKLAPGTEGGVTRLLPEGEQMSIFDASVKYAERGVRLSFSPAKNTAPALHATGQGSNCSAFAQSLPKALGAFTGQILWGWEFCRCNLKPAKIPISDAQARIYDFPGLTALLKAFRPTTAALLGVKATSNDRRRRRVYA